MSYKDKNEQDSKQFIRNSLKKSNKKLWISLSEEERNLVVDKYYSTIDIQNIGLEKVLENNRNLRISFGTLFLGVLFGIFGNIIASVILKHVHNNPSSDVILIAASFSFFIIAIRSLIKLSAENLNANKVLEYLVEAVKKDKV